MIRSILAALGVGLAIAAPASGAALVSHNKTFVIEFPHRSVIGHCHSAVVSHEGVSTDYIGVRCLPERSAAKPQVTSYTTTPAQCRGTYVRCFLMPALDTGGIGVEIVTNDGPNPGTPLMIEDHNGAPMFWCNLYGCYSGGDWGAEPGGLICVSNGVLANAACLTPTGTLELYRQDGTKQVLKSTDITWIHQQEAAQKAAK